MKMNLKKVKKESMSKNKHMNRTIHKIGRFFCSFAVNKASIRSFSIANYEEKFTEEDIKSLMYSDLSSEAKM
jgi:hypothetical protein